LPGANVARLTTLRPADNIHEAVLFRRQRRERDARGPGVAGGAQTPVFVGHAERREPRQRDVQRREAVGRRVERVEAGEGAPRQPRAGRLRARELGREDQKDEERRAARQRD
jgi:hypothetical protein